MAIVIRRIQGQEGLELFPKLAPHVLVPTGEEDMINREYLPFLQQAFQQHSEEVLVIAALDGEEVKALLIAQRTQYSVFLTNFWSAPGNSWKIADEMFLWVLMWTIVSGRTDIRADTRRDVPAVFRRFGLTERSVVVERKITPELIAATFNQAREAFKCQ